jgi:hypothetical protein
LLSGSNNWEIRGLELSGLAFSGLLNKLMVHARLWLPVISRLAK